MLVLFIPLSVIVKQYLFFFQKVLLGSNRCSFEDTHFSSLTSSLTSKKKQKTDGDINGTSPEGLLVSF